ncbi:MAG TPA: C45 family autoproteolytic acyltransferase/hydrolase [Tepidisphaeraceae bacterium]|nr:C45 family autoproteolytic acyltransferase/hydrolase [Tepidisphaeraceae bacterium]
MRLRFYCCLLCVFVLLPMPARGAELTPDPASVQREGRAYRYPQAGWIVVHVEGEPYQRGLQQGKLLWREIQEYIRCFAVQQSSEAPSDGWKLTRTMADALFVRRFDPELLEEMKGIADGAAAGGAKFDGRAVDLTDIVAINAWPELESLDDALLAQPTGLEGKSFEKPSSRVAPGPSVSRCSAFAATGPATRDGKAIIGHITMFDLYPCNFFDVWIDVKPARGHRLVIQGAPGSVQSGMDWYINDAGMVLTETTIAQTRFEPNGMAVGSRSRRAMQYGDSIDSVAKLLGERGNGLYTNEWLLADMKTNEIALYELGTHTTRLMRSSRDEWFGGTKGFYWGCNNTKDLPVRMETIAGANDRPADMTFHPTDRDMAWVRLYQQNKGSIGPDFARLAFGRPPLAQRESCDAKFTTAEMALSLKSFAHWGDPYGQLWEPSPKEREEYHHIHAIVPCDWTLLTTDPPAVTGADKAAVAVDLKGRNSDEESQAADYRDDNDKALPAVVWHGTLIPATDGDIWLTSAFARFQEYVAREHELLKAHAREGSTPLTQDERDELAVWMFKVRSAAMTAGAAQQSVPLRKIKSDASDDAWFSSASNRGVMLLAELRRRLGSERFDAAMEAFGREHAGKPVDSEAFLSAMTAIGGSDLREFFAHWIDSADALPTLELAGVKSEHKDGGYRVSGQVVAHGPCPPASIDVTLETADDEVTNTFPFASATAQFKINSEKKPLRVVVNKYGPTPCANGWNWGAGGFDRSDQAVSGFEADLEHTLIVYGTQVEADANRIAAEKLQRAIIDHPQHLTVPFKSDSEVTDQDLRGRHLLLIGRPECNSVTARLARSLPLTFGPRSFVVRGQIYANADSAVIAGGENPTDAHYSIVCIAGLSPQATLGAALALPHGAPAPLKVLPAHQAAKDIVPPATGLVFEMK